MRQRNILWCLAALLVGQKAQCFPAQGSSSSQSPSQSDQLHRRRPNGPVTSIDSIASDLPQAESLSLTSDIPEPKSTDETSDVVSSKSITSSRATTDKASATTESPISTTTDSDTSTITASATTTSSPRTETTLALSASTLSTPSSTVTSTATASPIPNETTQSFRMSAGSIAATAVLCCFVFGGAAIMLIYRIHKNRAGRRRHHWNRLASDKISGPEPKTFGHGSTSSAGSARESMMYHPDHRGSQSVVAASEDGWSQRVNEQEPALNYRFAQHDIPLSPVEPEWDAGRSQASPLIRPALPRAASSSIITRKSARSSLRREFSFEDSQTSPPLPSPEIMINRRSALTSNPPSDWPLATPPNYYTQSLLPTARPERNNSRTVQR